MRALFVAFLLMVACSELHNKEFTTFYSNNSYGLINSKGDTIIFPGKYHFLNPVDEQGMILAQLGSKWGYIGVKQNVIIPFEYNKITVFSSNGLAPAKKNGSWGFIDRKGKVVIPFQFENATSFQKNGLAKVKKNDKYGFVDKTGKTIIPINYENADITSEDNFVLLQKGNKWAFFNNEGSQLSDFIFDKIYETKGLSSYFGYGLVLVERNKELAFLDKSLNYIVPFGTYDYAETFVSEGTAIVANNNKYGIINSKGELILPLEYDLIEHPSLYSNISNMLILNKNEYIQVLDSKLKSLTDFNIVYYKYDGTLFVKTKEGMMGSFSNIGSIPIVYEFLDSFGKNYIAKKENYFGIISPQNEIVLSFEYDSIEPVYLRSYAFIEKDGEIGIVDNTGNIIVPFEYEAIYQTWYNNKANSVDTLIVQKNQKLGTIDINNNIIIPIVYDGLSGWIEYGPNEHYAKKDGKYGLVSHKGDIVIPIDYDYLHYYGVATVEVKKNDKYSILNISNEPILPCIYEYIYVDYNFEEEDGFFIVKHQNVWKHFDLKGSLIRDNIPYREIKGEYPIEYEDTRTNEDPDYDLYSIK